MRFRKFTETVEAFRYGITPPPEWFMAAALRQEVVDRCDDYCIIKTQGGRMRANKGDYVVFGEDGVITPVPKETFEQTYDVVWHGFK